MARSPSSASAVLTPRMVRPLTAHVSGSRPSSIWRSGRAIGSLVQFSINDVSVPIHVAHRFGESRTLADWPRSGPGSYHLPGQLTDPVAVADRHRGLREAWRRRARCPHQRSRATSADVDHPRRTTSGWSRRAPHPAAVGKTPSSRNCCVCVELSTGRWGNQASFGCSHRSPRTRITCFPGGSVRSQGAVDP